jgi:hypothetical protein
MAYVRQLDRLSGELDGLTESLRLLRVTLTEDKPPQADLVLLDRLRDSTEDCLGCLAEARAAQRGARIRMRAPAELARCQKQVNEIASRFWRDLACWTAALELYRLGRERRGEWGSWVSEVQQNLERCRLPLEGVNSALQGCWEDFVAEQQPVWNLSATPREIGELVPAGREE